MYFVDKKTNAISLVRGDTLILNVTLYKSKGNEEYIPEEGDVITFALKKIIENQPKSKSAEPILTKIIPIDTMQLCLTPQDTEELLFGDYSYDISITFADGRVDTFIPLSPFKLLEEVG